MKISIVAALVLASFLLGVPAWAQSSIGMPLNPLGGRAGGQIPRNTAGTTWSAQNITPPVTLKDGPVITPNAYNSCFYLLTLTGNSHILQLPVGLPPQGGEWCTFEIRQDGNGPYSLIVDQRYLFPNGTFALTQAANGRDIFSCANPPGFLECGSPLLALASVALSTYDSGRIASLSNISLSNANRTALINSGSDTIVPTTLFHSSGKWNAQFTVTHVSGGQSTAVGFAASSTALNTYLGRTTDSFGVFDNGDVFINNAVLSSTGIPMANGDVINLVFDITANTIQEAKNGGALSSPITVTGLSVSNVSPAASLHANPDQITWTPTPTTTYAGASPWN